MSAIIAEYNPFHNGHLKQINHLKKRGVTHVVAIMSGNFIQRGDIAIFSKKTRTKLALNNGIDLVIEIPVEHSLACAEIFAKSAVFLANSLGCVNSLCFGCENPDIAKLQIVSEIIHSSEISHKTKKYLDSGINFPAARARAIYETHPDIHLNFYSKPNNILALEYLHAISCFNSQIIPLAMPREVPHDSKHCTNRITSALNIRNLIYESNPSYKDYIPSSDCQVLNYDIINGYAPASIKNIERAILYHLRKAIPSDFHKTPDIGSEGLENRIITAAKSANSFENLLYLIRTKRYPLSRLRRIILSNFLGITCNYQQSNPQYVRILGFSKKGEKLLKLINNSAAIPLIVRATDANKLNCRIQDKFALNCQANNIYTLATPCIHGNSEFKDFPIKI